jgi:hypothetical protein
MKKCKICRLPVDRWPIQPRNSMADVCSIECAKLLAQVTDQKKREKEQSKKTKADRERIKSLSTLCSEAQAAVNKYIMARDRAAGYACISCGNPNITEAGHLYHAGSKYRTSRLRFDHAVINAQCGDCNRFQGGRPLEYVQGFIARYGQQAYKDLQELKRKADCGELKPLTKDEVRKIKADHLRMAREIVKR